MRITNLLLMVALGTATVSAKPETRVKIDCGQAKTPAPVCEVKRKRETTRPGFFDHGAARVKPKTVHL